MTNEPDAPGSPCEICSSLRDQEYATHKHGWEEHDTSLPPAAGLLEVVRDLQPHSFRQLQLWRCPTCGTHYLYRTDYEYLAGGSEDEEILTRLPPEEAAAYLQRPAPE